VAHPKIQRSLFTAGMTAAMLAVPFGGSAFALSGVEETLAPVAETADETLPAPVAEAVDQAAAPVAGAVEEHAKPVVDQILEAAPPPVQDAAGKVAPSQPSAGPVSTSPVRPAAPRSGGQPSSVSEPAPAAAPSQRAEDPALWRARQALLSQPMTTTPFPAITDMLSTDAPLTAGREGSGTATPISTDASGWLVAMATGLLVAMGAAHVAYADGRLTRANA